MKVKEFIKKYHLIAYFIMIFVIAVIGLSVKWYRYDSFVATYGPNLGAAYKYFNILLALILVAATVLFYVFVIRKPAIEKCFLAVSLSIGMLFIFFMPPNTPADEDKHMFAVTEFSNGIIGIKDSDKEYTTFYRQCDAESGFTRSISISNYLLMGKKLTERADNLLVEYETEHFNYAWSTVFLYLPSIVGMTISKSLGLGTVIMYFICRLLTLLTYTGLGYLAIKKIPTGKAVLAAVMLLPSAISRAACVSQDALMNGFAFLFVAYALYFAFSDKTIKVKECVVAVLAATFMIMGKSGAYAPLLLLLLMVPKANFGAKVKYPAIVGISVFYAMIIFLVANPGLLSDLLGIGGSVQSDLVWTDAPAYGVKNILLNPGRSVKMVINTIVAFGGQFFGEMISGGYGWLQIYSSPLVVAMCFIPVLMLAISSEHQTVVFTTKQRIITLGAVVASLGLIALSMWAFWTPINFNYIAGLQGRYFIILLFPVMMTLRNNKLVIKNNIEKKCIFMLALMSVFVLFEMWTKIA